MIIKIALIISIILQFIAAIVAVTLIKRTKYNIAWMLVSLGLILMAIRRLIELIPFLDQQQDIPLVTIAHWMGVAISIVIALGVFYIRKIFKFMERVDIIRAGSEKRVLRAIIKTEEKERKHFAKELHDGLGPLLSTIKMSVSGLKNSNNEEKRNKIIENIDAVVNEAIMSIKEISNSLSPHILNNYGLFSAVKSFTDKINESNSVKIVLNSNLKDIRFDFNTETILYRVICELINNTLKHANASQINIDLFLEKKNISIYYFDDGVGFNIDKVLNNETSGMGYSNIITRLRSINGTLTAESETGSGVHININVEVSHIERNSNKY